MSEKALLAIVAAAVLASGAGLAQAQTAPMLGDYSILGVDRVALRRDARVVSGAVGAVVGSVTLRRGARIGGTVAADTVRLAGMTEVGRAFCRLVVGGPFGGGVAGGPVVGGAPLPACLAAPSPILDPALLPPVAVTPGVDDLRVPRRSGTAPLPPANWADVVVGSGALLQLAGGAYTARSIQIGRSGRIVCTEACHIAVSRSVRLRAKAQLGARAGLPPTAVRIDIAADAPPPAFHARAQGVVAATVYSPAGIVLLGANGQYRGAFVGREVTVGARTQVRERSTL
jgi:hypothetical protein